MLCSREKTEKRSRPGDPDGAGPGHLAVGLCDAEDIEAFAVEPVGVGEVEVVHEPVGE